MRMPARDIQEKITKLFTQLDPHSEINTQYPWIPGCIESMKKEYQKISCATLTFRERARVLKKCNTLLRDFHQTCRQTYIAQYGPKNIPQWLDSKRGKSVDFYHQIIQKLHTLTLDDVYIISRMLPKSLSSYEENIHTLKKLEQSKSTTTSDYKLLLNICATLEVVLRLVEE